MRALDGALALHTLPTLPARLLRRGDGRSGAGDPTRAVGAAVPGLAAPLPDLPPLPSVPIDRGELDQIRSSFVAPEEFGTAQQLLKPSFPVLIITGHRGCGKRTMALSLLRERSNRMWESGSGELTICELLPDWEEPNVQRLPAERGHGYLLDLSRDSQPPVWPFAKGLRDHATRLRDHTSQPRDHAARLREHANQLQGHAARLTFADSYLVITATDEQWQHCDGILQQARVQLAGPPRARDLAERRVPQRRALLAHPLLAEWLGRPLPPADVVRFAGALASGTGGETAVVEAALNQLRCWRPYLADWFEHHPEVEHRALLVAAAVLDGSPADEICAAAAALVRGMPGTAPAPGPLAGPGRTRQLKVLDLPEPGPGQPVSLARQRPGLEDAVLDHVLREHPRLARELWRWLDTPAVAAGYATPRVARIADVLVRRSVRHGRAVFLNQLPGLVDAGGARRRLAMTLLERTVRDPVVGGRVRLQLARWARHGQTSRPLVAAIAEVCAGALGEQYPTVALATLREILLRRDASGAEAALAALVRLAGSGQHRRLVLHLLVRWMGHTHHRYAGGCGFLRLMRPDPGSVGLRLADDAQADPQVLGLLRVGWQRVRATGVPPHQVAELVSAWECAARRGALRRDLAADLLVLAVEEDTRQLVARRPGDRDRPDATMELLQRVYALRRGR